MMSKKKILFVTYGGGHVELIKVLIEECIDFSKYDVDVLALTVAYDQISSTGINKYRISDFSFLFKSESELIKEYGDMLLGDNFDASSGIPINDICFYLGLSFLDLVIAYGYEKAIQLYNLKKRQAFKPVTSLKRIINYLSPDILITTNSPRMEAASISASKELNIKSVQILDLFGDDYPKPSADFIIVMNERVKEKLESDKILGNILPLGQPILEKTIQQVGILNNCEIRESLGFNKSDQIVLFAPTPYYFWNDDLSVKSIGDEKLINYPTFEILKKISEEKNLKIIIRPHPVSDKIENYSHYLELSRNFFYFPKNKINIFESIAISKALITYNSTLAVQAAICNKTVFTYNYDDSQKYFWEVYKQKPFIFSNNFHDLYYNLSNFFSNQSSENDLNKFYEIGSIKRISEFINYRLWSF